MSGKVLDFEKPIIELESMIAALREHAEEKDSDYSKELGALERRLEAVRKEVYGNLSSWERTLLARHPERPYALDYIANIFEDFFELHGDRRYADDLAIVGGPARLGERDVMVIAQEKGRGTAEKVKRNFGMPNPEGYRKALRLMKTAEGFNRPIVTFVDTPGAYPGLGGEERGQAEAIALNLMEMSQLKVPVVTVVIGEGGSGGALGIAVANRVYMMENAIYSVISPEGCASILFRSAERAPQAANALRIAAPDLDRLGMLDGVIAEPGGGAHRDSKSAYENVKETLEKALKELSGWSPQKLADDRYQRFRKLGVVDTIKR